uniref:Uncharacterized protein n=1 Tax=Biomphalaria glabrata TaxID=6526 RepID=A0A2C9M4C1_BIOGL
MDSKRPLSSEMKKRPFETDLSLGQYKARTVMIFSFVWGITLMILLFFLTDAPRVIPLITKSPQVDLVMYKDLYVQDRWSGVEADLTNDPTVHTYWCGNKIFRFEDYLSLLSVLRVLRPAALIFHYSTLPQTDDDNYHTWFSELRQSVPNLVLRHTYQGPRCGSREVLAFGLRQLSKEGGVYLGERTVLTRELKEAWSRNLYYYNFRRLDLSYDVSQGFIFSKSGFPENKIDDIVNEIVASNKTCSTPDEFDSQPAKLHSYSDLNPCLVLTESLYPRDVWNSTARSGELARWLYYGRRGRQEVSQGRQGEDLIPLVSHMVWVTDNKSEEFQFLHYLSALSALHVAGFEKVFVHGELEPKGFWWDKLGQENVTFVKIPRPQTVFQRELKKPAHQTAVLQLNILFHHGGAYQDRDVIWVSKLPEYLRRYPAVVNLDWARRGEWPEVINMGVALAKPNADWLKYMLQTLRHYRADTWDFQTMPYKVYEQHPDSLFIDRYLQVICYKGICHPAWQTDYQRERDDFQPIINYNWRSARAFHFILPKPPTSLTSPEAIKEGFGMFAEMGRMILEKSGQADCIR